MTTGVASRAGLGERALALALDLALVGLLITGIGVFLTQCTGGMIRLGNTIIDAATCIPARGLPDELRLPEDFKVANVRRCTRAILGIPHDSTLTVAEEASGEPADRRQIVVPIDSAGRMADPFYLDNLTPLVLVAYLFLFEWRLGATIGKRALGIRVQALSGAPIDVYQAGKRSLMRMVPFLALIASAIYLGIDADPVKVTDFEPPIDARYSIDLWLWNGADSLDLWGIDAAVMIAFLLNYVVTTARHTLPWHDRWAGTEAVRHT